MVPRPCCAQVSDEQKKRNTSETRMFDTERPLKVSMNPDLDVACHRQGRNVKWKISVIRTAASAAKTDIRSALIGAHPVAKEDCDPAGRVRPGAAANYLVKPAGRPQRIPLRARLVIE